MTGHRRKSAVFVAAALVATALAVGGSGPAGALTVPVTCTGSDSVRPGTVTAEEAALQPAIDLFLAGLGPNKSQEILGIQDIESIDATVSARTDPASVAQGSSDIDFFVGLGFGSGLTLPVDSIKLTDILFELTPASGVTGAPLQGTPGDITVPLPPPAGGEQGPFTGTFDVTADIGGEATWDLSKAQVGIELTIPANTPLGEALPDGLPTALTIGLGLNCVPGSNPIVRSLVLPPNDPDGPVVPDQSFTTDQDTPITMDLLAEVTDGPVAETDRDSLEIFIDPAQGTLTEPDDGSVTYTPDAGYVGDDSFAYLVCTVPYVLETSTRGAGVEITSCNAGVVTVTMAAVLDESATTSTTASTTTTTAPAGGGAAQPQNVTASFTG